MGRDADIFDRFSRVYEYLAPPVDHERVDRALAHCDGRIERIADVGGGTGRVAGAVRGQDPVVVDAVDGMLRRARMHGLATIQADAGTLPFRENALDAIVVCDAIHHVGNRTAFLAEASRVIAPRGVLVVCDYDATSVRGRLLTLVRGDRVRFVFRPAR